MAIKKTPRILALERRLWNAITLHAKETWSEDTRTRSRRRVQTAIRLLLVAVRHDERSKNLHLG
jgi:hypothetical protein